jgi:hypothetical protein
MRTAILLFLTIFLFNCQSDNTNMDTDNKTGKLFFDYDAIDYYFNNIDELHSPELYDNHNTSADDSIRTKVIIGNTPKDIADLAFIDKLEAFGYSKSSVDTSLFKAINEVFSEKPPGNTLVRGCIYIYRDILVFKKKGKVIGTAKICFACGDAQIKGTTAYTDMFGQNDDYERLEKALKKQ